VTQAAGFAASDRVTEKAVGVGCAVSATRGVRCSVEQKNLNEVLHSSWHTIDYIYRLFRLSEDTDRVSVSSSSDYPDENALTRP
jgi:hypothetical protein